MHRSPPGWWGLPYKQDVAGFNSRAVHLARVAQRKSSVLTKRWSGVRLPLWVRKQHSMVAVAHSAERRVVTPEAAGANPVSHPKRVVDVGTSSGL